MRSASRASTARILVAVIAASGTGCGESENDGSPGASVGTASSISAGGSSDGAGGRGGAGGGTGGGTTSAGGGGTGGDGGAPGVGGTGGMGGSGGTGGLAPSCGDGACSPTDGESCTTCAEDCGACVCAFACQTAGDCAADIGAFSADNYTCVAGACTYKGCLGDAECNVTFPTKPQVCSNDPLPLCTPACVDAADCASDGGAFSVDNYTCDAGACRYLECVLDSECVQSFGPGVGCYVDGSVSYCQRTCIAAADCAVDTGASSADNWECNNGFCRYLGCHDTAECNVNAGTPLVCPGSCVPDCTALECGPDPVCGVPCGTCSGGRSCTAAGTCACVPDCTGLECGPDPVCGASCGICPMGACNGLGQCGPACIAPPTIIAASSVTLSEPGFPAFWWLEDVGNGNLIASPVTFDMPLDAACEYNVCDLGPPYCQGVVIPSSLDQGVLYEFVVTRGQGANQRQIMVRFMSDAIGPAITQVFVLNPGTYVWSGADAVLTSVSVTGSSAFPSLSWQWAP